MSEFPASSGDTFEASQAAVVEALAEAHALRPADVHILRRLALHLFWTDQTSAALAAYLKLLRLTPYDPMVRAIIYNLFKYTREAPALEHLPAQQAMHGPNHSPGLGAHDLLLTLVMSLAEAGRYGEAEPLLRQAIDRDPALPGMHAYLTTVYQDTGRNREACLVSCGFPISGGDVFTEEFTLQYLLGRNRRPRAMNAEAARG